MPTRWLLITSLATSLATTFALGACEPGGVDAFSWSAAFSAETIGPSSCALRFTIDADRGGAGTALELASMAAQARVERDQAGAWLRGLAIPLPALGVSAAIAPPDGLHLRDLVLVVDRPWPLQVIGVSPGRVTLTATTTLSLRWALTLPDGHPYRLGPAVLDGIEVAISIDKEPSGDLMMLDAGCAGICWQIPGLLAVRDLRLELRAAVQLEPLGGGG